ncbi:MAG: hypothetical protein KME37_09610 [Candidatus Thiodiazotropha sp. (ex Codakia orbicularis)]|nr:hypothetical protein [Candidatus Thiodiazotropha sp. (ex Codakia orbicularis)]
MLTNILMSWLVLFAVWRLASRWLITYDPVTHDASLQGELDALKQKLTECRRDLEQARWELDKERKEQAGVDPTGRKFTKLKRAFSKHYHPDSQTSKSVLGDKSRAMVFKDFWPIIQEVERDKSG